MSVPPALAAFHLSHDELATPVAWIGADGHLLACNGAFARWIGVGARRLQTLPLAALEADGDGLEQALQSGAGHARLARRALAFPGRAPRFADVLLSARGDGSWLLEAHPVDEFPGADPAQLLPAALSAALKGLAHELRNPLAGVKGAAQLLARRAALRADNHDERELIALIDDEVARLTALLDQLLSPTTPRPHVALNIHAVLERVLRLAESDAGWAVRLVRDYDPSLPELAGDTDRLVQAVWNLVRNAIEAGASQVTLRTRAEHAPRTRRAASAGALVEDTPPLSVRVEIIDDGRGVPDDMTEQLFLPLVSGRAEGSGLGLALAQQVAREHRGSLAYRSRAGHTVFSLVLPVGRETEPGRRAPAIEDAASSPTQTPAPRR